MSNKYNFLLSIALIALKTCTHHNQSKTDIILDNNLQTELYKYYPIKYPDDNNIDNEELIEEWEKQLDFIFNDAKLLLEALIKPE